MIVFIYFCLLLRFINESIVFTKDNSLSSYESPSKRKASDLDSSKGKTVESKSEWDYESFGNEDDDEDEDEEEEFKWASQALNKAITISKVVSNSNKNKALTELKQYYQEFFEGKTDKQGLKELGHYLSGKLETLSLSKKNTSRTEPAASDVKSTISQPVVSKDTSGSEPTSCEEKSIINQVGQSKKGSTVDYIIDKESSDMPGFGDEGD